MEKDNQQKAQWKEEVRREQKRALKERPNLTREEMQSVKNVRSLSGAGILQYEAERVGWNEAINYFADILKKL